jgi:hypothetical protein
MEQIILVLTVTSVVLIYLLELIKLMIHHFKIGLKILICIVLQVPKSDSLDQCSSLDGQYLPQLFLVLEISMAERKFIYVQ